MIPSLTQEEMTQYASSAQTIQEPQGADYSRGVQVGRTIPAKWWNWLFSNITKRIVQSRSDADSMLTELKNVVTDEGLTPSSSDNTQLVQAISKKTSAQIDNYVLNKKGFMSRWEYLRTAGFADLDLTYNRTFTLKSKPRYYNGFFDFIYDIAYEPTSYVGRYVVVSKDGINWHTSVFVPPTSRGMEIAVFAYGDAMYRLIGYYPHFTLYRTTDLVNWSALVDIDPGTYSPGGSGFVFELNGIMYVTAVRYFTSSTVGVITYRLNKDGTATLVGTQEVASSAYLVWDKLVQNNEWYPDVLEAKQFNSTKYLVGPGLFDGTNWDFTTLPNLSPDSRCFIADMRMIEASSGARLIYADASSDKWLYIAAGSSTPAYNADSVQWNFIPVKGDTDAVLMKQYGSTRYLAGKITATSGLSLAEFSYRPTTQAEMFYLNGKYYWGDHCSTNMTDWDSVEGLPGTGAVSKTLAYSLIDDSAYCICDLGNDGYEVYITRDNMATWQRSDIQRKGIYYSPDYNAPTTSQELALSNGTLLRYQLIYGPKPDAPNTNSIVGVVNRTDNSVNTVIQHTLYLK